MKRRAHGEGSITKRANGRYLAQVTIDRKRVTRVFDTRREAQEWITTTTRQVARGLRFNSLTTTVDELLAEWLVSKQAKTRPATIESYRRMARLYLSPELGRLKLKDLSAARVQAFYNDLQRRETGARTIVICHQVLHGFLDYAQRQGLVAQNWSKLAEVPRHEKREMSVWDESQVSQFLQFINADPFYRLVFATGMRRGEIIGLQWKDIDWQAGMIQVRRQVCEPEGGGFIFQNPKTERGRRAIRLGKGMLEALRYHYTVTIPQMQAVAGDRWQDHDLIFPTSVGTPINGYEVSKRFKELVIQSGLPPIRFHDIRHTAASIMLLHGEPPVRVAAILGQTVAVLLSVYAHYIQDDQERAANLMDEITTPTSIDLSAVVETDANPTHPIRIRK